MTIYEFLDSLAMIDGPMELTLSPGPFVIKVDKYDGVAAHILRELYDSAGEYDTIGDSEKILLENIAKRIQAGGDLLSQEVRSLLNAWWWLVFWASQTRSDNESYPIKERE